MAEGERPSDSGTLVTRWKTGVGSKLSSFKPPTKWENSTPGKSKIVIPDIIGLPPLPTNENPTKNLLYNSMIHGYILPCRSKLTTGLTVYEVKDAFKTSSGKGKSYLKLLEELELKYSRTDYLRIAVFADHFPNENFVNDYSESFLESMAGAVSGVAGEITQMTGEKDVTSAANKLNEMLKKTGSLGEKLGGAFESAGKTAGEAWKKGTEGNQEVKKFGELVNRLAGGARVDFPMIWKNSAFNPTYSITIRLFNPAASDDQSYNKYIVGPLGALLCLAVPQTEDNGNTYSYPFVHKVNFPGMFRSDASAITSISVTKGAENLVSFKQRPSLVEVRIDFINLFSTIVTGSSEQTNRPTLKSYLDNLKSYKHVTKINPSSTNNSSSKSSVFMSSLENEKDKYFAQLKGIITPTSSLPTTDIPAGDRISTFSESIQNDLINKGGGVPIS